MAKGDKKTFVRGDVVTLTSGGPPMTIASDKLDEEGKIECSWFCVEGFVSDSEDHSYIPIWYTSPFAGRFYPDCLEYLPDHSHDEDDADAWKRGLTEEPEDEESEEEEEL